MKFDVRVRTVEAIDGARDLLTCGWGGALSSGCDLMSEGMFFSTSFCEPLLRRLMQNHHRQNIANSATTPPTTPPTIAPVLDLELSSLETLLELEVGMHLT